MIVVKLGGAALKSTLQNAELFRAFAASNQDMVIVHGGGPEINALAERLGLKAEFWNGQRVTSAEMLEVVELVLCGKINPTLVRGFNKAGRLACGLSGSSAGLFRCEPEDSRLGLVGHVQSVFDAPLRALLREKILPVVAPVGVFADDSPTGAFAKGSPCNVNADLAAAGIAKALRADRLLFLTDRDGVLDSQGDVIREISAGSLAQLAQSETITGGMRVKARAMLEVIEAVPECRVEVMNGMDATSLAGALDGRLGGTVLKAR